MKPVYAIPLTAVVTVVVGQNFNSGSFSGTATFTISGSAVTVGGTNAATFVVGSSTITVGGASSTASSSDAAVSAASDDSSSDSDADSDGTSSAQAEDEDDDSDAAAATSSTGNSIIDGFISTYSGGLLTLPLSSATITLGSFTLAPSAGFGAFPFNATTTRTVTPSVSGADSTGSDSGEATATPSGPSTSLGIITDVPTATSTGTAKSLSTVLIFLGAAITYLL
ncbi:hypothetical protein FHL15_003290 [Xylaria flabelliformis]|uniref:Uncharacterized protein n=1 Tax=Xylaria flabelliformis TaxID=2512241 RepID=A0A553I698_9PEZI|nr:hypothetical protein FHL15_003290 [Xylaria flabelliformis]